MHISKPTQPVVVATVPPEPDDSRPPAMRAPSSEHFADEMRILVQQNAEAAARLQLPVAPRLVPLRSTSGGRFSEDMRVAREAYGLRTPKPVRPNSTPFASSGRFSEDMRVAREACGLPTPKPMRAKSTPFVSDGSIRGDMQALPGSREKIKLDSSGEWPEKLINWARKRWNAFKTKRKAPSASADKG